jgi:hypothetical protein
MKSINVHGGDVGAHTKLVSDQIALAILAYRAGASRQTRRCNKADKRQSNEKLEHSNFLDCTENDNNDF